MLLVGMDGGGGGGGGGGGVNALGKLPLAPLHKQC